MFVSITIISYINLFLKCFSKIIGVGYVNIIKEESTFKSFGFDFIKSEWFLLILKTL